jgi:hypothetical protein
MRKLAPNLDGFWDFEVHNFCATQPIIFIKISITVILAMLGVAGKILKKYEFFATHSKEDKDRVKR